MAKLVPEKIQTLLGIFKFNIDDDCIHEDLACTICQKMLHDAYQSPCGCKYCRKCIVSYINDGNDYCPGGKDPCLEELLVFDESVCPSAAFNKKVLKVRVRCPNESCQFVSNLTQMDDHLKVCSLQPLECLNIKIGCTKVRLNRDSVETHLNKDLLIQSQMLIKVVDNLKNEVGTWKEEVRANKLEIASLREEFKLKERKIREEERAALTTVVKGLKGEVAALRGQVKMAKENQKKQIKLEEDVMKLRREIEIEREKSRRMSGEIDALKKEVEIDRAESSKMSGKIDSLKNEIEREQLRKMRGEFEILQEDVQRTNDGRIENTEEEVAGNIDGSFSELTKTVDILSKWINKGDAVGSLWFKVDGLNELRKKRGTIVSPHFYSHINGYKLRILVNLSSYGYLDVCSIICKGEYDDVLSWPASGLSVLVTVINHHTKETYATRTFKYDNQYGSKPIDTDNEPYHNWWVSLPSPASTPGVIVSDSLLLLVIARPP